MFQGNLIKGKDWKILEKVPGELDQRNKLRVKMSRPNKPYKLGGCNRRNLGRIFWE